jgi:hypothetical protein
MNHRLSKLVLTNNPVIISANIENDSMTLFTENIGTAERVFYIMGVIPISAFNNFYPSSEGFYR